MIPWSVSRYQIVSSSPQLAPTGISAAHSDRTGPPAIGTVRNSPLDQNPKCVLSGEKNGVRESSVPEMGLA